MDDIFTEVSDDQNETPENPLETLVGEGKKFATAEELAKGKLESDRFINQLQNELAELRQEVSKQMTIDEILTQIKSSQIKEVQTEQNRADPPLEKSGNEYSPEQIAELVQKQMGAYEAQKRVQKNEEIVSSKLRERFGADAQIHLNKKAKELGVTLDYLKGIAKDNPSAFFKLIDLNSNEKPTPTPAPRSNVSIPSSSQGRDKAYYDRLKATDRKTYLSQETQMQLYKDMEKVLREGGTWE